MCGCFRKFNAYNFKTGCHFHTGTYGLQLQAIFSGKKIMCTVLIGFISSYKVVLLIERTRYYFVHNLTFLILQIVFLHVFTHNDPYLFPKIAFFVERELRSGYDNRLVGNHGLYICNHVKIYM